MRTSTLGAFITPSPLLGRFMVPRMLEKCSKSRPSSGNIDTICRVCRRVRLLSCVLPQTIARWAFRRTVAAQLCAPMISGSGKPYGARILQPGPTRTQTHIVYYYGREQERVHACCFPIRQFLHTSDRSDSTRIIYKYMFRGGPIPGKYDINGLNHVRRVGPVRQGSSAHACQGAICEIRPLINTSQ